MKSIQQKLKEYNEIRAKCERSDIDEEERQRALSKLGHIKHSLKKAIDNLPKV